MKIYNIGEALLNFKLDTIAYVFKGNAKGSLIWVDLNNNNQLVVAYEDGVIKHGIYVSIQDVPKEEGQCIVFVNEVKESLKNDMNEEETKATLTMIADIEEAIARVAKVFQEGIEELSPEEQEYIYAILAKQQAEQKARMEKGEIANEEN